jgi:guanylate kinase
VARHRGLGTTAAYPTLPLRARLRQRGSEAQGDVEQRIARAVDEIEFSLSARCFDKVVLNDDFERAYAELKAGIDEATMSS